MFWRTPNAVPADKSALETVVQGIVRDPKLRTQQNSCGYTMKVVFEGFENVKDRFPGVHAITFSVNAFMSGVGDHHMVLFVDEKPALREANPHGSIAPDAVLGLAHSYKGYFDAHAVFGERARQWWAGLGDALKSCSGRPNLTCMSRWFAHLDAIVEPSAKTSDTNPDEDYIMAMVRSKIERGLDPPPIARLKYNVRTFLVDGGMYATGPGVMVGGGKATTCAALLAVVVLMSTF